MSTTPDGYGQAGIPKNITDKKDVAHVHRILLAHSQGMKYNDVRIKGLDAMHSCDNPKCANIKHLSFGTTKDNVHDMISKGRRVIATTINPIRGENHVSSKLKEQDVMEIRQLYQDGLTQVSVAEKYNVSRGAIGHIVNRQTWKHVM